MSYAYFSSSPVCPITGGDLSPQVLMLMAIHTKKDPKIDTTPFPVQKGVTYRDCVSFTECTYFTFEYIRRSIIPICRHPDARKFPVSYYCPYWDNDDVKCPVKITCGRNQ
jgi:hypothetical protein